MIVNLVWHVTPGVERCQDRTPAREIGQEVCLQELIFGSRHGHRHRGSGTGAREQPLPLIAGTVRSPAWLSLRQAHENYGEDRHA